MIHDVDIVERLNLLSARLSDDGAYVDSDICVFAIEEIKRLRELFKTDGEQHAEHIKGLTEQHEVRIEKYYSEIERLRKMVKDAYNIGFAEGMKEVTSSRGGIPWNDSKFRRMLEKSSDD